MAEFGASAANLQPSQGDDRPVVLQKTSVPASTVGQGINSLASLLGQGVDNYYNVQMLKAKQGVLSNVSQRQGAINDALASGQMSPQEAHARSMAINNEALASYPQLASDINGLAAAFKNNTQIGDADQSVKTQQQQAAALRTDQLSKATSEGYYIPNDSSPALQDTIIRASQAGIQARKTLEDQQAQLSFRRSQTDFSQAQEDRQRKMQAVPILADFAGKQMDAFDAQVQALRDDVAANRISPQDAQAKLGSVYGSVSGVLQATAGINQELASPYRSIFDEKYKLAQQLLDPTKTSDQLQAQYKATITKSQLQLIAQDPKLQNVVAASQMLGSNNPILQSLVPVQTMQSFANLINNPVTNGQSANYTQNIIGSPQEGDVLKSLKFGIDQMRGGKYADQMAAGQEGTNAVNNLLAQVGDLYNKGVPAQNLKGMADFFASSQYAYMMQNGQIDPQANKAAAMTFQKLYEPTIVQAVGGRMNGTIPGLSDSNKSQMFNNVDADFTAAGVTFSPKKGLSPDDAQKVQAYIDNNMKSASQGMNTVLRMGAHMEGTVDYQKYWENNKYILLPQLYPVKPGQKIGNATWSGNGDWRDPNSWKVDNGGSNDNK